jgi:hypothetical protein
VCFNVSLGDGSSSGKGRSLNLLFLNEQLVKSRIHFKSAGSPDGGKSPPTSSSSASYHVGLKIRANPSNESALRPVQVVMAVPPNLAGERYSAATVAGQAVGSVRWDGLQRVLIWTVPELAPGATCEAQAKLEASTHTTAMPLKFPVLVRADGAAPSWSSVRVESDTMGNDDDCHVQLQVSSTARVLHRKI